MGCSPVTPGLGCPSYSPTIPAARGFRGSRVTRVMADPAVSGLGRGHGRPARLVCRKTGGTPVLPELPPRLLPNPTRRARVQGLPRNSECYCRRCSFWLGQGAWASRRRPARVVRRKTDGMPIPPELPPQLLQNHTRPRASFEAFPKPATRQLATRHWWPRRPPHRLPNRRRPATGHRHRPSPRHLPRLTNAPCAHKAKPDPISFSSPGPTPPAPPATAESVVPHPQPAPHTPAARNPDPRQSEAPLAHDHARPQHHSPIVRSVHPRSHP